MKKPKKTATERFAEDLNVKHPADVPADITPEPAPVVEGPVEPDPEPVEPSDIESGISIKATHIDRPMKQKMRQLGRGFSKLKWGSRRNLRK